ncbi:MAG: DNA polymerase III subunit delta, partial [Bdellovibrionales bacterium]|nr:DNA polymerase III subunit delta [Bdellovibrionales bacterium]
MSVDLMKWLKGSPPLKNLYFVVGEESFFIREIKRSFLKRVFRKKEMADFNYEEFDASHGSVDSLRAVVETFPIMADRRLVFCHSAQKFSEKDWGILMSVIEQPISSTVLVFFLDKIDKRKKHFKVLAKQGEELPAHSLRDWEVDPWIDFVVEKEGLKLTAPTKELFRQLVGLDLLEMGNEIQKLKSYMGERSLVEESDILAVISRTRVDSIFTFTDAVGRRDLACSLDSLARLLENQQSVIGVLVLVARH